jgi:CRISPR-associated protein Csb1
MTLDLTPLDHARKLLLSVPLKPVQGHRVQPTGFPDLGAATFQANDAPCLLVESAQSMANRLEATAWDPATNELQACLKGLSYVRVERGGEYLTSSITEAHRLNSPYILEGKDRSFVEQITDSLGAVAEGPINRKQLAETLLRYDANSRAPRCVPGEEGAGWRTIASRASNRCVHRGGARRTSRIRGCEE